MESQMQSSTESHNLNIQEVQTNSENYTEVWIRNRNF